MGHYYYGGGVSGLGLGLLGLLLTIIFWALVISLVIVIVRALVGRGRHGRWHGMHDFHRDSALQILKERYAKGEIDKKEFEEKKKDLEV